MKKVLLILFVFTTLIFTGTVNANETGIGIFAAVVSISDSPNPYVVGQAYSTDSVGFSISDQKGGDKVYGSGDIEVKNNSWSHTISTDLPNGGYEIILYIDNKEYDRKGFTINTKGDLYLSITPDEVVEGDDISIRFNDVGADYYNLTALCKETINISGKARPDLCVEGEKIYPTGKDVILVDGFYPSADADVTAHIRVGAIVNGKEVRNEMEAIRIIPVLNSKEDSDFSEMFDKYGDIKFENPEEGERHIEEFVAGQVFTLKWENVVKAQWGIDLYKHDKYVSKDYLRNGPTNVDTGKKIAYLGTAYLGQGDFQVKLPSNLEEGYYYFRFGGKAAGDSSPAIKIISEDGDELEKDSKHLDQETVVYNSEAEQIRELIKILTNLLEQLIALQARG